MHCSSNISSELSYTLKQKSVDQTKAGWLPRLLGTGVAAQDDIVVDDPPVTIRKGTIGFVREVDSHGNLEDDRFWIKWDGQRAALPCKECELALLDQVRSTKPSVGGTFTVVLPVFAHHFPSPNKVTLQKGTVGTIMKVDTKVY